MKLVNLCKNSRAADSENPLRIYWCQCHVIMAWCSLVCPASFAGWKSKGGKFKKSGKKSGSFPHEIWEFPSSKGFVWLEVADQKDVTWCCWLPKVTLILLEATTFWSDLPALNLGSVYEMLRNQNQTSSIRYLKKLVLAWRYLIRYGTAGWIFLLLWPRCFCRKDMQWGVAYKQSSHADEDVYVQRDCLYNLTL